MSERDPNTLRSYRWYGPDSLRAFGHRSRARQSGLGDKDFFGKPVIGILNTWTDLNSCHMHFKSTVESVKRGVLQAGGMPMEIPVMSCGESLTKPTSMLYRNFLAMEAEEMIRANPVDCAILLGGCDKSTPALIMGAISAGVPAVYVPSGPMIKGNWHGQVLGSGSDVWGYWDERRAGTPHVRSGHWLTRCWKSLISLGPIFPVNDVKLPPLPLRHLRCSIVQSSDPDHWPLLPVWKRKDQEILMNRYVELSD